MEGTLSSKGQATIPKAVRERLHLKPGDRFKFYFHPDGVIILPKIPMSRLKGIIPKPARRASLDEIDAAIEAGAPPRVTRQKSVDSIPICFCVIYGKTSPGHLPPRS